MTAAAKPTSVVETLRAARALIEDPSRWIKNDLARKSKHSQFVVWPEDTEAGAWCSVGALRRVDGPFERDAMQVLANAVQGTFGVRYDAPNAEIIMFNDAARRRHKEVLAKYDQAIALAEAEQS